MVEGLEGGVEGTFAGCAEGGAEGEAWVCDGWDLGGGIGGGRGRGVGFLCGLDAVERRVLEDVAGDGEDAFHSRFGVAGLLWWLGDIDVARGFGFDDG